MNKGGGILRKKNSGTDGEARRAAAITSAGRVVTFSAQNDVARHDHGHIVHHANTSTPNNNDSDGSYDSDEVEDAILASGDGFSSTSVGGGKRKHVGDDDNDDDIDMNDDSAAFRSAAEIEEAKRRRGRARRGIGKSEEGDIDIAKYDENDGGSSSGWKDIDDTDDDHHENGQGFSLITDQNADLDAYESNAAGNASCPVEPFNMDAEKEGGMGYFDGDTYVFRQNKKPIDGEEDAWLDGSSDDEEGGSGKAGGGILNSTAVWKPPSKSKTDDPSKRKAKFVSEDDSPEQLGRRLATLLQSDNETVMTALTRYGTTIRDLQSQQQSIEKKSQLKRRKRKSKSTHGAKEDGDSTSDKKALDAEASFEDGSNPDVMKELKRKMEQTRETVEELTEITDALLFGGETEAYELTKMDWIHRYKLAEYFPNSSLAQPKRPNSFDIEQAHTQKKSRVGYFDTDINNTDDNSEQQRTASPKPPMCEVTWEYKGNEDGIIHGPYTSRQMLEWITCGYFIGESAVDIRRVGSASVSNKSKDGDDAKADVDDLMADLLDDDDDDEVAPKKNASSTTSCWMRSDEVDFSSYL